MMFKFKYDIFDLNKIDIRGKEYYFSKKINNKIKNKLYELADNYPIFNNYSDDEIIYFLQKYFKTLITCTNLTPNEINNLHNNILQIIIFDDKVRTSNWLITNINKFFKKYKDKNFNELLDFIYKYLYKII